MLPQAGKNNVSGPCFSFCLEGENSTVAGLTRSLVYQNVSVPLDFIPTSLAIPSEPQGSDKMCKTLNNV